MVGRALPCSGRMETLPRPDLAGRLETEVRKRWQPQIRARARQQAATTGGIVIDTRARIGYTAPIGTTDEDRLRHPDCRTAAPLRRPPLRRPGAWGQGPGTRDQGPATRELKEIAAEALKEVVLPGRWPPRRPAGGGALPRHRAPRVRPVENGRDDVSPGRWPGAGTLGRSAI
ncbi:telomere-protecting terminal protein Tpg [Streptomyces mirabilis]|uniref:telomere-protecting terminal protein Tpg n=1 Tax=Streptomyces mirabilis TaxID=68239 RepID=UPI003D9E98DD